MKNLRAAVTVLLLAGVGCASNQAVHKENRVSGPVTLPLEMCAERGTVAVSKGNQGERMICERQTPLGTHLPYCMCRDEGMVAQQSEDTFNLVHLIEKNVQLHHGG